MVSMRKIQKRLRELGLYEGKIDGIAGVRTRAAVRAFQRINGLRVDGDPGAKTQAALWPQDIPERIAPEPAIVRRGQRHAADWPRQRDVEKVFGKPGGRQCTAGRVKLPFPMRIAWNKGKRIRSFACHEKVARPIERIFEKTLDHYGPEDIRHLGLDLFGGCYNFRKMRGGNRYPMHAWGIAVDLDPQRNQLRWGSDRARLAEPDCRAFWEIVASEGAIGLGPLRNFDWMHFQFARL